MEKFIFATDIHGDMQDKASVDALLEFTKDFKPTLKICGGDLHDLRPLRKGADHDERKETMKHDWVMGLDFLTRWKPHVFLHGNHDKRIDKLLDGDGPLVDHAESLIADRSKACHKIKCEQLPYHADRGVYQSGKLSFLHGYHHGESASKMHALSYGHCVFGHIHTHDAVSVKRRDRAMGHSVPCMCNTDMEYEATRTNLFRKSNGWAFGYILDSGDYELHIVKKRFNGKFCIPSAFEEY